MLTVSRTSASASPSTEMIYCHQSLSSIPSRKVTIPSSFHFPSRSVEFPLSSCLLNSGFGFSPFLPSSLPSFISAAADRSTLVSVDSTPFLLSFSFQGLFSLYHYSSSTNLPTPPPLSSISLSSVFIIILLPFFSFYTSSHVNSPTFLHFPVDAFPDSYFCVQQFDSIDYCLYCFCLACFLRQIHC